MFRPKNTYQGLKPDSPDSMSKKQSQFVLIKETNGTTVGQWEDIVLRLFCDS